jgi:hypothetical protein
VVPLIRDHPCCTEKVVFVEGWSLQRGIFWYVMFNSATKKAVFVEGWSFRGEPLYVTMLKNL